MSAPAVAVSSDGKKFAAAWMDQRTGKNDPDVYWAVATSPSFAQDGLVHEDTKGVQNHPSIAIDKSGTVWTVWEDARSGAYRVYLRSSAKGDRERMLSDDADGPATYATIACNGGVIGVTYECEKDRVVFRLVEPK